MIRTDQILTLAPHLILEAGRDEGVAFLLGERERYIVPDPVAVGVLMAVDGVRTVGEVVTACVDLASPPEVHSVLTRFEARGMLRVGGARGARAAFEVGSASHDLLTRQVVVVDLTDGAHGMARHVAGALDGAGFERARDASEGAITVIVTDDYLSATTRAAARRAWQAGRPLYLVKPLGLRACFGPLFVPSPGSACPACMTHALRELRPMETLVCRWRGTTDWPRMPEAGVETSIGAVANLAALDLRRRLSRLDIALAPRMQVLDLPDMRLSEHVVRRRPQCPVCGDPGVQARRGARPIRLEATAVGFARDGGLRRQSPEQAYARLRHLVDPLLGPVTHLHPMPGRHRAGRPVFSSGHMICPRDGWDHNVFDRNCAGKGWSFEQARMSALAEAIERYSSVYQGDEARETATRVSLGEQAIDPHHVMLFSDAQRVAAPSALPERHTAPQRLEPEETIDWSPAWSLTHDIRRYIPLALCYTAAPSTTGAHVCRPSSNGCAAGNGIEEAILQGLFELVERDAAAVWWYNRLQRPRARTPARVSVEFEAKRREYRRDGWSLWALDLTHDIGSSVVVAVAVDGDDDRFFLGFGAHQCPALALKRALSEVDQVFDPDPAGYSPWNGLRASELPHLFPVDDAPRAPAIPGPETDDLARIIGFWVDRLDQLGLETVVVDKTRADIDLDVVHVFVPGLRHAWPRFAPGRLFDVPPRLGWSAGPLDETELNPHPLLI